MGHRDCTFGLFSSFFLFLVFLGEMIVAEAKINGLMEGFSKYFSLLSVATGGFHVSYYCYAKHDFM